MKCWLKGHNIIIEYGVWDMIKETRHKRIMVQHKGGYCNECSKYIKKIRRRDKVS